MSDLGPHGFAGPFRAFDAQAMPAIRALLEERVFSIDGPDPRSRDQSRHLDCAEVMALCRCEEIVGRAAAILGPRTVLWRSNFFPKPPGAGEFVWHSDRSHWKDLLSPMINVTAWLAIDPATQAAGCLEFMRGSRPEDAVTMQMEPGEFVLFDQDAVHRSGANGTDRPRLALAVRFTLDDVIIKRDERLPAPYRTFALHELVR